MANIDIDNVVKRYGDTQVLHDISLKIADGEFLTLVGPSGCGKSTLLRMVAGLENISGGTVTIGDQVVNDKAPKDRNVAMVFQNYALYPHLTVAQNMGFSLRLRKAPKEEFDRAVNEAASILGLHELLDRLPGQLSGGQRQRVAMGRAIVRDPDVFLFDEPLSNLDAKLRAQMRLEITGLHDRLHTTVLYVTHDQIEAMTMADRIVVLRAGFIEQVGSPLELYDDPDNRFVAGFLGSPAMNFVPGELRGNAPAAFACADGTVVPVHGGAVPGRTGALELGFRPESVRVVGDGGIPGRVVAVEPTGANTHVVADVAGQQVTLVVSERVTAAAGDVIRFEMDAERIYFFDPDTGKRVRA